jgi:hypothetical protein
MIAFSFDAAGTGKAKYDGYGFVATEWSQGLPVIVQDENFF